MDQVRYLVQGLLQGTATSGGTSASGDKMVRWMCNVKVKDRVPSKELRERLGIDDIILILQQNKL